MAYDEISKRDSQESYRPTESQSKDPRAKPYFDWAEDVEQDMTESKEIAKGTSDAAQSVVADMTVKIPSKESDTKNVPEQQPSTLNGNAVIYLHGKDVRVPERSETKLNPFAEPFIPPRTPLGCNQPFTTSFHHVQPFSVPHYWTQAQHMPHMYASQQQLVANWGPQHESTAASSQTQLYFGSFMWRPENERGVSGREAHPVALTVRSSGSSLGPSPPASETPASSELADPAILSFSKPVQQDSGEPAYTRPAEGASQVQQSEVPVSPFLWQLGLLGASKDGKLPTNPTPAQRSPTASETPQPAIPAWRRSTAAATYADMVRASNWGTAMQNAPESSNVSTEDPRERNDVLRYECPLCDETRSHPWAWINHIKWEHSDDAARLLAAVPHENNDWEYDGPLHIVFSECPTCGRVFRHKKALRKHMKGNHGIEISQPADGIVPMRLLYPPIAANTAAANDPRSPEELKEPEELEFDEPNEFEEADPAYSSATESWGGRQAISDPVSANRSGVFEDPREMQPDPIYGCPMCNFVSGQDWKSHIEQVHPEYLALLPELSHHLLER